MYVRYFGKAPSVAEIAKYNDFKTPKLILTEIRGDADDSKATLTTKEFVNNAFQNLFGRDATTKEMNKYAKVVDAGKDLPINAIVKSAKKSDKGAYEAKKAIAIMLAEQKNTTNYNLDKITKDTYADVYNLKTKKLLVDTVAQLETKIEAMPENVTGQTYTLTTSIDTLVGSDRGDVFEGIVDSATTTNSTLTALDSIDGKEGKDTLNVLATAALTLPAGLTVANVETVNFKAGTTIVADTTTWTGLTTANVTKATTASVTAATTTDVNVSGATDDITVKGGNDITITDNTAASSIKVEDTTSDTKGNYATGKITITDTKFGLGQTIDVDGGSDVTVTATADKVNVGKITVGANKTATGDVKIVSNTTSDGTATTAGSVYVTGGKTVEITANMTNTAVKGKVGAVDITAGTYKVTADNTTTNVTITQNATATDFENDAAAATFETAVVTFGALKAGESVAISYGTQDITAPASDDLTFTASKDLTAEQVAAAFANLTDTTDTQSATGITANGYFTGKLDSGWTSGAVSGSSVTFTATTAGVLGSDITVNTDATNNWSSADNATANANFGVVVTQGVAAGTPTAVLVAEKFGDVVVDDNTTKSITTITLDGFDKADLGGTTAAKSLDKLATLNLTNGQSTGTTTLNSTVATLTVNVDDMAGTVDLDGAGVTTLKTLTLNANGEDSDIALSAVGVETLTIAAAADLDISAAGTNLSALKTATITGARDVNLGDLSASASFATLNASAAKGDITAEITATNTAVTTGSGNDTITATVGAVSTAISKAIDLGAGDDTLVLFDDTTVVPTAAVKGGAGVDTISMTFTSAASYDANENFKNAISGFERLEINNVVTSAQTIELANLGFTSYVTTTGTTTGATYTGAVTAATSGEKFTFFYNGLEYTAKLAGTDVAAFNTAIDTAVITGTTTVLGANKVTATDSAGTLVLAADVAGNTVTAGSYDNAGVAIVGTTTTLKLNNLAANATVVLSAAGSVEAVLATATGTADVINVIIDANSTTTNAGAFTVNSVETVKITAKGEFLDDGVTGGTANDGIDDTAADIASLTLKADAAKTVTIDGYADLTLDTVSTTITKVDASAMTGDLVYTADGATAGTEVIGGAGNDTLIASGENDVLKGGAGNDTFYATDLTTVHGGAGADKFYFATPTQLSKVSTIADLGSGDTIYLVDNENGAGVVVDKFYSAGAQYNANTTTTFEAKVNASLVQTGAGESTWFQHAGNTYIVIDNDEVGAGDPLAGAVDTYTAGKDVVIEITGLVDLSTASFNTTTGTLEIA